MWTENEGHNDHLKSGKKNFESAKLIDEQLWLRFRSGDEQATSLLYSAYLDDLYNYGMNLYADQEMVSDCIQDLFLDLWKRKSNLGSAHNVKSYLLASLRRRILKQAKYQRLTISREHSKMEFLLEKNAEKQYQKPTPGQPNADKRLSDIIESYIEELPIRQKEAIYHIYYLNNSYEEAATIMDVDIKTVYNLAWRGIKRLRKRLTKNKLFILSIAAFVLLIYFLL